MLCRVVQYRLSENDVGMINRRRADAKANMPAIRENKTGYIAHFGNDVSVGETYPLIITRDWENGKYNGQVLLDGNDTLWVTSVEEGEGPRTFTVYKGAK